MKYGLTLITLLIGMVIFTQPVFAGDHQLGLGVHYWDVVDDIDIAGIKDSGYSWVISYQYKPTLIGFQFDLEFAKDQVGAVNKMAYSPQAFVIIGSTIYGGLGVGTHYSDGDFTDPFYALKAGFDFELLPHIHLDLNANYRFEKWDIEAVKKDVDTDTVTLGAVARLEF